MSYDGGMSIDGPHPVDLGPDGPYAGIAGTVREWFHQGASREHVLLRLHGLGYTKLRSGLILMLATGSSLAEAQDAVHRSRTWQDRYQPDEDLYADLEVALRLLQDEEVGGE